MKVMVFGATGAVGRPLVRMLRERGDTVIGTTRSAGSGSAALAELGAEAVVCDALDGEAVRRAVDAHRPEVIVNQLTSLSAPLNPRRYSEWLAPTNRLRAEGTSHIVAAAQASGVRRLVSQSIAFAYRWGGEGPCTEDEPLFDRDLGFGEGVAALRELERLTLGMPSGAVLRYGWFYGPGTGYGRDGAFAQMVARRAYPIIGRGTGVFSFVHVEDAAAAAVATIDSGATGVFNIVDDDPAPMREWLPSYAAALAAPRPRRVPLWIARLATARYVADGGVHQRGASNARAKAELGWTPRWPSWRDGFARALAAESA
jgi:nucleoside-diphosphate-sugar epimerase